MNLSNIFVFSYDVSHPAPATPQERNRLFAMDMANVKSLEPSVVGFAANMAKDPYNFIGDYFFQASRQESIDPVYLERAFRYSFSKAKENRNDRFNARLVFVIRDGISEGECQMAVNQELEVLRRVREKFLGANEESRFVFVMVNKRHGKRFFNIEDNRTDNLNKCSAIDTTVVRPDVTEFYLMSHTPIRGTAKIPQYLKLYDDVNMPQNVLEDFLHVMCHNHQISLGGVSIPAPVYLAHELAKRGRNNFLCAREKNLIDPGDVTVTAENRDFVRLSKNLGYRQNSINNLRFTA